MIGRSVCEYLERSNGKVRIEGFRQETEQLSHASASLTKENSVLKELLDRMQQGTEDEACSIYLQLRSEPNVSVLVLAQRLALQAPDGTSELGAEKSVDSSMSTTEKELQSFATKAWTTVADYKLVSELVASWFMWNDAQVCACLDREALLGPAVAGGTKFCSSFLINVICAARCVSSVSRSRIRILSNLTTYPVRIYRV